ncbi:hypothetical protein BC833DRAFT_599036 [Globomyces pollinis-pini]|nr:hypothetical protein BC833DRAFT_599036 [Globomyces pollinis-pini]
MSLETWTEVYVPGVLISLTILMSSCSLMYFLKGFLVNRNILWLMITYQITILLFSAVNIWYLATGAQSFPAAIFRIVLSSLLTLLSVTINLRILNIFRIINPKINEYHIRFGHAISLILYMLLCGSLYYPDLINLRALIMYAIWTAIAVLYDNFQQGYLIYLVYSSIKDKSKYAVNSAFVRTMMFNTMAIVFQWMGFASLLIDLFVDHSETDLYVQLAAFLYFLHGNVISLIFVSLADLKFSEHTAGSGVIPLHNVESEKIRFPISMSNERSKPSTIPSTSIALSGETIPIGGTSRRKSVHIIKDIEEDDTVHDTVLRL